MSRGVVVLEPSVCTWLLETGVALDVLMWSRGGMFVFVPALEGYKHRIVVHLSRSFVSLCISCRCDLSHCDLITGLSSCEPLAADIGSLFADKSHNKLEEKMYCS